MSVIDAEVRALLTLRLVPGLGPLRIAALRERFGSAEAALTASAAALAEVPTIGDRLAGSLVEARTRVDVERELGQMERFGVRLIALGAPEYPAALATIADAPPLLYLRGTLTPADANAVALVGSRHGTDYGKRMASRLASGLARAGFTIVSGLARGIDGVAHRAALQAGGRTLAVLAGGLSRIYPPEHTDLSREVEAVGAVLTESPMGQEPLPGLFPVRNRIISGLARAVVVVEAAERSGALSTASHAGDQGRTVLAVPGPVDTDSSGGCNELIRKGAVLCRSVEDVLEELHGISALVTAQKAGTLPVAPPPPAAPAAPPPGLDETQRRVWECLAEGPRHLDELVQRLGLGVPLLSGTLLMLEMKKTVRRLPGNRYERC
jgi:DNA processing protein